MQVIKGSDRARPLEDNTINLNNNSFQEMRGLINPDNENNLTQIKTHHDENNKESKLKQKWIVAQLIKMNLDINKAQNLILQMDFDLEKEEILHQIIEELMRPFTQIEILTNSKEILKTEKNVEQNPCLIQKTENYIRAFLHSKKLSPKESARDSKSGEKTIEVKIIDQNSKKQCPICLEKRICIGEYLSYCIFNGKVLQIPCPQEGCRREPLTDNEISSFLNEGAYKKYIRIKQNKLVSLNPNVKYCIRPGCERVLNKVKASDKLICVCKQEICFKCSEPWHEGGTCEEAIENGYKMYLDKMKLIVKECPKCREKIEKIGGCNHMTCSCCRYEFCWLCRKTYSSNHFKWWNFRGCPAKLFYNTSQQVSCWNEFEAQTIIVVGSIVRVFVVTFILFIISIMSLIAGIVFGFNIPFQLLEKYEKLRVCKYSEVGAAAAAVLLFPFLYLIGVVLSFLYLITNFDVTNCSIRF